MSKPTCYKIELPVSEDHAEMLTDEMLRQGFIAEQLGLAFICDYYSDKEDFFIAHCFDNLWGIENETGN